MTQYYAYELVDPRNNKPFYIGKGKEDRMYRHKKQAFQKKGSKINPHKSAKIRQIINEGHEIKYIKYECTSEEVAFKLERKLIKKYKEGLTNLTDGGEGHTGGHVPVCQYNKFGELIKKHRSAKDAAVSLGKKYYSQITGCCSGRETSAFGFLWSYEGEQPKLLSKVKVVYQWTPEGEFVERYTSCAEAARKMKCDASNIPNAIKNGWLSCGFVWSHESHPPFHHNSE